MMKIKLIMEAIRDDMAARLPSLFHDEGVKNVDHFTIGSPANQEQKFCCLGLVALQDKRKLEFVIHLAIPGVGELESYGYIQALKEYLDGPFDQTAYGFDAGEYELYVIENEFTHGDIQILFNVSMSRQTDDCS
ncbi:MAG: hypothetical protein LBH70_05830 [Spirochaetaceae bacterium]|jgi:hypothetical protein|nr:hypothetical protein [Spirochaetaceae bacterium]